ncbi:hypothetical protein TNCV_690981 [Trichonephila clavipes]|nr:hypothetical protein TNCV_690981 [Trichonephila clavipes]
MKHDIRAKLSLSAAMMIGAKVLSAILCPSSPKQSVLQAMTKRVLFQRRSGASASHVVLRRSAEVEVKVLMREVG